MKFSGPDYSPQHDQARLTRQYDRIFNLMKDGKWRTLREIELLTKASQASISAQLRHARRPENGGHTVEKEARGDRKDGLFQYRLIVREPKQSEYKQVSLFETVGG